MDKIKFIIGITGGSGVGKTTLIQKLYEEFEGRVSTFSLDNYYLPKEQQEKDENGIINFDLPSALNESLIESDLKKLLNGNTIQHDVYNFNNPDVKDEKISILPNELLIIEGLYVLHYPFLRSCIDYSVYIYVDPNIQLERRLIRDISERNYSKEDVLYQWKNHVIPSYKNYVEPYKIGADLIITNNSEFDENIHILTSVIHQKLDSKE